MDRTLQGLDEQVSSAVTKALEKWRLNIKAERTSNHRRVAPDEISSLHPLGVMSDGRSTLNFLLRSASLPHAMSIRDAINSYRRDQRLSWHIN